MLRTPLLIERMGSSASPYLTNSTSKLLKEILPQHKQSLLFSTLTNRYAYTSHHHHRSSLLLKTIRADQNRISSREPLAANTLRKFSDKPPSPDGEKAKDIPNNEERTDLVLTPGQKVVAGTRLTMYLGMFAAGITCLYFTVRELMPTKMSPNTVFNNAHSILANNTDVTYRFGSPIKTYGKDHGGKREGRRNFIEHSEYTDQEDGSKRTRVRFNLEGPKGNAFVFAEVSKDMPSGEFVYLLVQDKRNGRVITVIDNRSMLVAKRMAGGSKEGEDAFASLLSGGRSK